MAGAIALMQQAALEEKGCFLTTPQVIETLEQTATSMPEFQAHEVGRDALDASAAILGAWEAPKVDRNEPWVCPPVQG